MLALVTCVEAGGVDTDLPLLRRELPDAAIVSWDDPAVEWSSFRTVVIRSPWDYHRRRADFLAWAAAVCAVSDLWNPLPVIRWNTDKRYLGDVDRWGVPIVTTTFLPDAATIEQFAADGRFHGRLVVKPSIGASASGVLATFDDDAAAFDHATALLAAGLTPMVQPYLSGVESDGETGLVYFRGEFSHAFRRKVVLRHGEIGGDVLGDERSERRRPTRAERAVGDAVLARLPDTAYARVDLLPTADGPVVLEVELTEPSLFLHVDDGAPARAAAAFRSL